MMQVVRRRPMRTLTFAAFRDAAVLGLALALAVVNVSRADHCGQASGCVDLYWANFWLILSSDGHERRVALGEVVRIFAGGELHYLTLNLLTLGVALLILIAMFGLVLGRLRSTRFGAIAFVGLLAGPSTTVLFEALGDPLQVALLLVIAYALVLPRLGRAVAVASGGLAVLAVTLIHEASLFLFLPVVYLLVVHRLAAQARATVLAALIGLGVLAVLLLSDGGPVSRSGIALITQAPEPYRVEASPLPSFTALLAAELDYYFGSPKGPAYLLLRLIGAFLWPALALTVLSLHYRDWRPLRIFLLLVVVSLPLYAIARDWGRFTSYSLLSAILVHWTALRLGHDAWPARRAAVGALRSWMAAAVARSSSVLPYLLLVYQSHDYYRVDGLTRANSAVLLACLALLALIGPASPGPERDEEPDDGADGHGDRR